MKIHRSLAMGMTGTQYGMKTCKIRQDKKWTCNESHMCHISLTSNNCKFKKHVEKNHLLIRNQTDWPKWEHLVHHVSIRNNTSGHSWFFVFCFLATAYLLLVIMHLKSMQVKHMKPFYLSVSLKINK